MSTRCHIQVKNADGTMHPCMIYKHSDGYPEGVLPWLTEFVKSFHADRGDDAEYCIAQILRQWAIDDYLQNVTDDFYIKNPSCLRQNTGWGVCLQRKPRGDIDYMYTVNLQDGTVLHCHV